MISVQPSALQKITARHLSRQAMLYVRQSTLHQVLENTESTARQYALRERAIALGWEASRIVVIDSDLYGSRDPPSRLRSHHIHAPGTWRSERRGPDRWSQRIPDLFADPAIGPARPRFGVSHIDATDLERSLVSSYPGAGRSH